MVADRVDSATIVADLDKIHRVGTKPRSVPPEKRAPGNLGTRLDGEDGWPTYYTRAADPKGRDTSVTCNPAATDDGTTGACPTHSGPGFYQRIVRVPLGAKPNGGVSVDGSDPATADRHMTVVDQSAQPPREYDFWKVKPYSGPSGTPPRMTVAGMGWEAVNVGSGVSEAFPGGATAAAFGNLAGRIRAEELNEAIQHADDDAQGVLRHAITISVECHSGLATPPALYAPRGGACDAGRAAPMGARLYLPSNFAIGPAWHPWQKVILRTIKQYGMYINDTGAGRVLFNMQKEGGLQYLVEGAPNNWWYTATGSQSRPTLGSCERRGWQSYGNGGTFVGCAAHFDQNRTNPVPLAVWRQLRVAALTVDRAMRPSSGPAAGGRPVTLHGTGLRGNVQVSFGGATVAGTGSRDGTSVTVVPPPHVPGAVDVSVTAPVVGQPTPARVTLPGGYRYLSGTNATVAW